MAEDSYAWQSPYYDENDTRRRIIPLYTEFAVRLGELRDYIREVCSEKNIPWDSRFDPLFERAEICQALMRAARVDQLVKYRLIVIEDKLRDILRMYPEKFIAEVSITKPNHVWVKFLDGDEVTIPVDFMIYHRRTFIKRTTPEAAEHTRKVHGI